MIKPPIQLVYLLAAFFGADLASQYVLDRGLSEDLACIQIFNL